MPTIRSLSLLTIAVAAMISTPSRSAENTGRHEGGWSIYPRQKLSPIVETWVAPGLPREITFRLVSREHEPLAELKMPAIPAGYSIDTFGCKVDGVYRNDVIAVVKYRKYKQWTHVIRQAWTADPKARAFVPIKNGGMLCEQEMGDD